MFVFVFQCANKSISLTGADVGICRVDNKQFAFHVRPKGTKRTYYICADNESSRTQWIDAIGTVSHTKDASQACVVQ